MDIYQNNEHILKKSRFSNKSGRLPHKAVELTCMILLRVSWHQYSLLWHTVKNECKWIGNLTPQIFNNLNGIVSRKLQTKHMGLQSKGNNSASQQQVHIARFYVNFVESKHSHLITSQCLQTTENDPPPSPQKMFLMGKWKPVWKITKKQPHWWLNQTVIPIIFPRVVLSQSDPVPLSKQKECIHWSFGLLPLLFFELPLFGWWPRSRMGTRSGVGITFLLKLLIDT